MSNLIEELREEQVSRLAEKVEALAKEIQAIKNPPKKKSLFFIYHNKKARS